MKKGMWSLKYLIFSLFVYGLVLFETTYGNLSYHPRGRMVEPPPRLSLWRHGYDTTKYNQDNELSCYIRKHRKRFKKESDQNECGLCGETSLVAESLINDHTVNIVRTYQQGQKIKVGILLITPTVRRGWFQFQLCSKCSPNEPETEYCFEKHSLSALSLSRVDPNRSLNARLATAAEVDHIAPKEHRSRFEEIDNLIERQNSENLYPIPADLPPDTVLIIELQLPADVSCEACVLRWRYFAGKHKRLYGCADVRILMASYQGADPDCAPFGSQLGDEQMVVLHRRDQVSYGVTQPTFETTTSQIPNYNHTLVNSTVKGEKTTTEETTIKTTNLYSEQAPSTYPYMYRKKFHVEKNHSLAKAYRKLIRASTAPMVRGGISIIYVWIFYPLIIIFTFIAE